MTLTFSPPLLLKSFSKTILPEIPYEQSIRLITVALFPVVDRMSPKSNLENHL